MSDEWEWTQEREKCLDRVLAGWPKKQIAEDLKVHRNTISNWCAHPEFQRRIRDYHSEQQGEVRQRRLRETNMFTDRVAKLASKALDRVEDMPLDQRSLHTAREWLEEYKGFREQERIDMGDNVQRHAIAVGGSVQHTHEHAISQKSFKGFLEDAIGKGIIDAKSIESTDPHELVTALTTQALLMTDVLDKIQEEERAQDDDGLSFLDSKNG